MNKYQWSNSEGTLVVELTHEQVEMAAHAGSCDEGVATVVNMEREQLDKLTSERLRNTLREYGIDGVDDMDRATLEMYIVWVAAWDIEEDAENYWVKEVK